MGIEEVLISEIDFDVTKTQVRDGIDNELVATYAQVWREHGDEPGSPFVGEPIRLVCLPDGRHCIGDGWHRCLAAKEAEKETVPAEVEEGFEREAIWIAAGANGAHGRQLTNAEKRRIVETVLNDEEWSKLTDQKIAKHCGVSQPFVSRIRAERRGEPSQKQQLWATSGIGTSDVKTTELSGRPVASTLDGGFCKSLSGQPDGGGSGAACQNEPSPNLDCPPSKGRVTSAYATSGGTTRAAEAIWKDAQASLSRLVKGVDELYDATDRTFEPSKEHDCVLQALDEVLERTETLRDFAEARERERN